MPDQEIILHHYWESPYAEKIRRIFGLKRIAWRSVVIPMVAPKPDLVALTGGYRKTPVLQIGADVWCDTDAIAREIERRVPEPTLFPDGTESLSFMLGPWQGELFWLAVLTIGTSTPIFPDGFLEDRSTMLEGGLSMEKILTELAPQRDQLRSKLSLLDARLASRGPFLLGAAVSLADFSLFHPLFGLSAFEETRPVLEPYPAVLAWLQRLGEIGHGTFTDLPSADAIAIARDATPDVAAGIDAAEPNAYPAGARVEIVHESFGNDPVVGTLVGSSAQEIVVVRTDPRAGEVAVHFPREHYHVRVV